MCDHLTAVGRVATSLLLVPLKLPAMLILCQGRDFDDFDYEDFGDDDDGNDDDFDMIMIMIMIMMTRATTMMMMLVQENGS